MALNSTVDVVATVTRPNDTTAYASGDVLTDNTSAGSASPLNFDKVARYEGWGGTILSVQVVDSANQATAPVLELWLFTAPPAGQADNGAFVPTDAILQSTLIGIVPISTRYVGDATVGTGGNSVLQADQVNLPYVCSSSYNDIWGYLVLRNAYTPVANERFDIKLKILQD